jgi:polyisoprenoid-binding protein YceI
MSRLHQPSLSLASDARADEKALEARVTFTASGPLGLRVRGRGKELVCLEDGKSLVFSVPLRGITTGISMRDGAMHDLLGTRRFPTVELRVPRAAVTLPKGKGGAEGTVKGTLTLRGKSAPIDVCYELEHHRDTLAVTGTMRVSVDTWGISLPHHMGFGLKSQVAVKVVFNVFAKSFLGV